MSENTAGVQVTAQTIDACSRSWRFIIPPWARIKQSPCLSAAPLWWMISWEISKSLCFLKPSTRTPSQHTKTHFQHVHFLHTGPEVRQIRSHVALRNSHDAAWKHRAPGSIQDSLTKTRRVERIVFLSRTHTWRNGVKYFHHNAAYCLGDNVALFLSIPPVFFLPFLGENNGWRGPPTEWWWCVLGAVTPADEAHLFCFTHQTRSNCELGVK